MKESVEMFSITMTNDELQRELGADAMKLIDDAGFVLVPKRWRDEAAFPALRENAERRRKEGA